MPDGVVFVSVRWITEDGYLATAHNEDGVTDSDLDEAAERADENRFVPTRWRLA